MTLVREIIDEKIGKKNKQGQNNAALYTPQKDVKTKENLNDKLNSTLVDSLKKERVSAVM